MGTWVAAYTFFCNLLLWTCYLGAAWLGSRTTGWGWRKDGPGYMTWATQKGTESGGSLLSHQQTAQGVTSICDFQKAPEVVHLSNLPSTFHFFPQKFIIEKQTGELSWPLKKKKKKKKKGRKEEDPTAGRVGGVAAFLLVSNSVIFQKLTSAESAKFWGTGRAWARVSENVNTYLKHHLTAILQYSLHKRENFSALVFNFLVFVGLGMDLNVILT